jgi:hypothetical protein
MRKRLHALKTWIGCTTLGVSLCAATLAENATAQLLFPSTGASSTAAGPAWSIHPSEGVEASLQVTDGVMDITYDFKGQAGYAIVRLPLNLTLPANFAVGFTASGTGASNTLECKLVDGSVRGASAQPVGDDVWWYVQRPFGPVGQLSGDIPKQDFLLAARRFTFAWGPGAGKRPLAQLGAFEFAISSFTGGKGTLRVENFRIESLPEVAAVQEKPIATASSKMCVLHEPQNLFDDDLGTAWQCGSDDEKITYDINFGGVRGLGGITFNWEDGNAPARFEVLTSKDGTAWTPRADITQVDAQRTLMFIPETYTQHLRLAFTRTTPQTPVGIQTLTLHDLSFADSANTLLASIAKGSPRGAFPRMFLGEQSYWTVVGVPGDKLEALVTEEGSIEPFKGEFTVEPFVTLKVGDDVTLQTWENTTASFGFVEGFLPLPKVTRAGKDVSLNITVLGEGNVNDSTVLACYEVTNTSAATQTGTLMLAARPFQGIPPWHQLNLTGGSGRIASVKIDGDDLLVNGNRRIWLTTPPDRIATAGLNNGLDPDSLIERGVPRAQAVSIEESTAAAADHGVTVARDLNSAAALYDFTLAPGAAKRWWVIYPLHTSQRVQRLASPAGNSQADAFYRGKSEQTAAGWAKLITRTKFRVPPEAQPLVNSWYAAIGHIMINMDGPAFQPGSRTYERSWIRDGSLTSTAMLEAGYPELVKPFINWYGSYQFPYGKIPCVVDARGADPVDENDSTGQFIFAVMNYYKFTKDTEFLREQFPRIRKAVEYLQYMTAMRSTAEFQPQSDKPPTRQEPGKPPVPVTAFYGLVPESISHEGYSAKPMHSYWDNFFVLRGFKDAVKIAEVLGETDTAEQWKRARDTFATNLSKSIQQTQRAHGIDYIPGCVELGDFDSTSTTIALWPAQAEDILDPASIAATFDRYWSEFKARKDGTKEWDAYTPYENRHIGTYLRLGQRARAIEVMNWYLSNQRPAGWPQWQEVVWKKERKPDFIGDSPHTWCASDFMNSVRAVFAYERESDNSLVLFAGVPEVWIREKGVGFEKLPTQFGTLSAMVTRQKDLFTFVLDGDVTIPPGGLCITNPSDKAFERGTVNGKAASITPRGEVIVRELPATVVIKAF